jgi:hypothetical protein
VIAALERLTDDELDLLSPPNSWDGFTNDELDAIASGSKTVPLERIPQEVRDYQPPAEVIQKVKELMLELGITAQEVEHWAKGLN